MLQIGIHHPKDLPLSHPESQGHSGPQATLTVAVDEADPPLPACHFPEERRRLVIAVIDEDDFIALAGQHRLDRGNDGPDIGPLI